MVELGAFVTWWLYSKQPLSLILSKNMKIGIDARMYSDAFTGIGRYVYELTQFLFSKCDSDWEWVIFMNEPGFSRAGFSNPRVRKIKVNAPHYSFAEQTTFLRQLRQEKCNLVHFPHFNVPLGYHKKFITTIHDTTISFYPGKKMNSPWRKWAYQKVFSHAVRGAERIISVSENTKMDVIKLFNIPSPRITTIWNGIGDEFRETSETEVIAARKKFNLHDNFLLYTGVWREHKNLVGLLRAFRIILDQLQTRDEAAALKDLQLVLTGKPDLHYPEVSETITSLQLQDHIKPIGLVSQDDLIRLYGAATIYVFPSFYEGFGFPPLEAMKAQTPVAASRISAIPEVCGDAVLYFDPHQPTDMAKKIMQLLLDEKLQKTLVKKGEERVKLFSWQRSGERTLQVYQEVLKNN